MSNFVGFGPRPQVRDAEHVVAASQQGASPILDPVHSIRILTGTSVSCLSFLVQIVLLTLNAC